ncbi:hypothetical protein U8V72_21230 [Priestia filamentosa]|uniref:hypothetical protein n=1 Tax=Priestia filamentosa TaxID=1402861 RepID=UPI003977F59A
MEYIQQWTEEWRTFLHEEIEGDNRFVKLVNLSSEGAEKLKEASFKNVMIIQEPMINGLYEDICQIDFQVGDEYIRVYIDQFGSMFSKTKPTLINDRETNFLMSLFQKFKLDERAEKILEKTYSVNNSSFINEMYESKGLT